MKMVSGCIAATLLLLTSVSATSTTQAQAVPARAEQPWTEAEIQQAVIKGSLTVYRFTVKQGKTTTVEYEYRQNTGYDTNGPHEDRWREDGNGKVVQAKSSVKPKWGEYVPMLALGFTTGAKISTGKQHVNFAGDEWDFKPALPQFSGDEWSYKEYSESRTIAGKSISATAKFSTTRPGLMISYDGTSGTDTSRIELVDFRPGPRQLWADAPYSQTLVTSNYKPGRTYRYEVTSFDADRKPTKQVWCVKLGAMDATDHNLSTGYTVTKWREDGANKADQRSSYRKWDEWHPLRAMRFTAADTKLEAEIQLDFGGAQKMGRRLSRQELISKTRLDYVAEFTQEKADGLPLIKYEVREGRNLLYSVKLLEVINP